MVGDEVIKIQKVIRGYLGRLEATRVQLLNERNKLKTKKNTNSKTHLTQPSQQLISTDVRSNHSKDDVAKETKLSQEFRSQEKYDEDVILADSLKRKPMASHGPATSSQITHSVLQPPVANIQSDTLIIDNNVNTNATNTFKISPSIKPSTSSHHQPNPDLSNRLNELLSMMSSEQNDDFIDDNLQQQVHATVVTSGIPSRYAKKAGEGSSVLEVLPNNHTVVASIIKAQSSSSRKPSLSLPNNDSNIKIANKSVPKTNPLRISTASPVNSGRRANPPPSVADLLRIANRSSLAADTDSNDNDIANQNDQPDEWTRRSDDSLTTPSPSVPPSSSSSRHNDKTTYSVLAHKIKQNDEVEQHEEGVLTNFIETSSSPMTQQNSYYAMNGMKPPPPLPSSSAAAADNVVATSKTMKSNDESTSSQADTKSSSKGSSSSAVAPPPLSYEDYLYGQLQKPTKRQLLIAKQQEREKAVTKIQKIMRGYLARKAAKLRKLVLSDRFTCENCGRVQLPGVYCKGCGRKVPKKYRDKAKHIIEKLNLQKRLQMMVSAAAAGNNALVNGNNRNGSNKESTPKKSRPPSQRLSAFQPNDAAANGADSSNGNNVAHQNRQNKDFQEPSSRNSSRSNPNVNGSAFGIANTNATQNSRSGSGAAKRSSNVRAIAHPPVVLPSPSSQNPNKYGFNNMNLDGNIQSPMQQQNISNGDHLIPKPRKKSIRSPSTQLQAALAAAVGGGSGNYSQTDSGEDTRQYNQHSTSQQQQQQQQQQYGYREQAPPPMMLMQMPSPVHIVSQSVTTIGGNSLFTDPATINATRNHHAQSKQPPQQQHQQQYHNGDSPIRQNLHDLNISLRTSEEERLERELDELDKMRDQQREKILLLQQKKQKDYHVSSTTTTTTTTDTINKNRTSNSVNDEAPRRESKLISKQQKQQQQPPPQNNNSVNVQVPVPVQPYVKEKMAFKAGAKDFKPSPEEQRRMEQQKQEQLLKQRKEEEERLLQHQQQIRLQQQQQQRETEERLRQQEQQKQLEILRASQEPNAAPLNPQFEGLYTNDASSSYLVSFYKKKQPSATSSSTATGAGKDRKEFRNNDNISVFSENDKFKKQQQKQPSPNIDHEYAESMSLPPLFTNPGDSANHSGSLGRGRVLKSRQSTVSAPTSLLAEDASGGNVFKLPNITSSNEASTSAGSGIPRNKILTKRFSSVN